MNEPCWIEADTGSTLRTWFDALERHGCDPRWYGDGTGIIATCPVCREPDGLTVELPGRECGKSS